MFSVATRAVTRHGWRQPSCTTAALGRVASSARARAKSSIVQPDNTVRSPFPDVELPTGTSLPEFLFSGGRRDYVAIEDAVTKQCYSLDEVEENCARFGAGLVEHFDVERGDVIVVLCPNRPEYAVAFLGPMMAGCVVSTANTAYTSHELNKQLITAGAKYVVTTAEVHASVVDAALAGTAVKGVVLLDADGSRPSAAHDGDVAVLPYSLLLQSSPGRLPRLAIDAATDTAVIPFSSGTTGLPKGVMLSHQNLIANVLQVASHPELLDFRQSPDECVLCVMPFYHIYGMVVLLANGLYQRCRLLTVPKFDPNFFPGLIGREKVTQLFVAPPLVLFLLNDPRGQAADLSSVNFAFSAAAPLSHGVQSALSERLGGKPAVQGYGLTELSPISHASPKTGYKLGSIGTPVPSTTVKVRSLEGDSRPLPAHENGEICVRGPQVFQGYLNRPEATAEMLDSDGWLHTGDIGHYDEDGHFFIVDRLKELIKVKGYQVAPAELEAELLLHADITDAAAIGVPHERFGEVPRAFVVRRPGSDLTEDDVCAYIASRLTSYKHLVGGVEFVDELPKSSAGKLLRQVLRKRSN